MRLSTRQTVKRMQQLIGALVMSVSLTMSYTLAQSPVSPDADFTVREITQRLFETPPGVRPDFSGHDLTYLDLSGLDFKAARLTQSDFYGADFTGADLTRVDLSKTRLDRAVLIRATLKHADLTDATLLRPTIYQDMTTNLRDAPNFSGARLIGTRIQAELSGASFRGADLSGADLSPLESRPGEGTLVTLAHNTFKSCDFSGATLRKANLQSAIFMFSRFNGADLEDGDATDADFSKTDLRGANFSGTDIKNADFDGANLAGVIGLEHAKHFNDARNLDKAHGVPAALLSKWRRQQNTTSP